MPARVFVEPLLAQPLWVPAAVALGLQRERVSEQCVAEVVERGEHVEEVHLVGVGEVVAATVQQIWPGDGCRGIVHES